MIWPSVENPLVHDGVAVFVGNKAEEHPRPNDHPKATNPRLFAVKAPEPPLDINDDVLALGAKERGSSFALVPKSATVATLQKRNGGIDVRIAFVDWADREIKLDWNQISDIMREVREKGIVRKDRVWGTPYIERDIKLEDKK
jgi:hypothetical protein